MNPLRSFGGRRLVHALGMYILLVLSFSALFLPVADRGLRAQAAEEVTRRVLASGPLDSDTYEQLRLTTTAQVAREYHLDAPWQERLGRQAGSAALLQFGRSDSLKTSSGERNVGALILEALPNTLLLFTLEALLVLGLGILVGLRAFQKPRGPLSHALSFLPPVLEGLPSWWLAMLALMAFSYGLGWFPSGGRQSFPVPEGWAGAADLLWHLTLPLLLLVSLNLWSMAWQVQSLLATVAQQGPLQAARARGVPEGRILRVHALVMIRPAVLTQVVLGLLHSLSGNLLIEGIFGWPGLGSLYFLAVQQNDVPVLVGILSVQALINLVALVALDLSYRWFDPRLRLEAAR